MNRFISTLAIVFAFTAAGVRAEDLVPLKLDLPQPLLVGTPIPVDLPNVEPEIIGKRPDVLVPRGSVNIAAGKPVTASDSRPIIGTLNMITDGDKEAEEGSYVEMAARKQWVQIDLEKSSEIYAVCVWHFHSQKRVYLHVVVQVSDDPNFEKDVTTIFNADSRNELGLGAGKDRPYIEDYQGKLIDAGKVKGRYIRLYSKGNTTNKMNHYIEVEVFGKPAA